jgi:hypothetical protein
MRIYIAGPYTAPTDAERLANTNRAIDVGIALQRMGHAPLIPHLSHFVDERARPRGGAFAYEEWMAHGFAYLEHCEALLLLAPSPGADRELSFARAIGLKIYHSLGAVPPVGEE